MEEQTAVSSEEIQTKELEPVPDASAPSSTTPEEKPQKKRNNNKKNKKNQWSKSKTNTWIYVENLPKDTTEEVLEEVFRRFGIIQQTLEGAPRIKLYRDENGEVKGDASICYLRKESIPLAIQMQNGVPLRYTDKESIKVSEAVFTKHDGKEKKEKETNESPEDEKYKKLRRMHLQQQQQSLSWAEDGEEEREVGLKIIVIENLFSLEDCHKSTFVSEMKADILEGCSPFGEVEKVTVFENNPNGVVVVKFKHPTSANNCVKKMNGRFFAGRQLKAFFWDGKTDYRVKLTDEEENAKLNAFADWIEKDE